MGVSNWGGFVAYPYYLGGKLGRIQKTWFLAKRALGGNINPVLALFIIEHVDFPGCHVMFSGVYQFAPEQLPGPGKAKANVFQLIFQGRAVS